jgi:surface antigen
MTRTLPRIGALLAAAVLAACAAPPGHQNEQAGAVIGAVVGGVVGNQIGGGSGRAAATVIGAIAGGAIGATIGRSMDDMDRVRLAQTLEYNAVGAPTHWRNPDTGIEYTVRPRRTYVQPQGPCREYVMETMIGGRPETVYGTACRHPDGSWRAVN